MLQAIEITNDTYNGIECIYKALMNIFLLATIVALHSSLVSDLVGQSFKTSVASNLVSLFPKKNSESQVLPG